MAYPYSLAPTLCRGCEQEFTPTDPRQTDCKKGCGRNKRELQTNDWLLRNKPHFPTEPCLQCGKPVVQYRKRRRDGDLRYCSYRCMGDAYSVSKLTAAWPPVLAGVSSPVGVRCIDCGQRVLRARRCKAHSDARKSHLQKLRTRILWLMPKQCAQCGEQFNRFDSGWRCDRCKKRNARQVRALRRARKRGASSYDSGINHESVHDRSAGVCALCNQPTLDPSVWFGWNRNSWMPLAPTVDHVIPLAKGGTHTWSNVQLAHLYCNALKSDR